MLLMIRRYGSLIDIPDGWDGPTPPRIVSLLAPALRYDHKRYLQGAEAYDPVTGRRERWDVQPTNLYEMVQGRFTTSFGFLSRITQILQAAGYDPRLNDLSPERQRPDCYETDWDSVRRHIEFRARQEDCLHAIENSEGGLVNASTGFGKTHSFLAMTLLYPKAKFAIVVGPKDVAQRIVRDLTRVHPNVGYVGGGNQSYGRVTVYTAGSVHHCDGDVDFMLADEAHQMLAPKTSEKLGEIFRWSRNYAFTGTPEGRADGANIKMELLFGPEIFRLSYQDAEELGLVVPMHVRWLPIVTRTNPAAGKEGVPKMRWGVWRNQERNALIAQDIRTHFPNDEQILISVATLDHALHLAQFLPEFTVVYSNADDDRIATHRRQGMIPENFQKMTPELRNTYRIAFESGALRRAIATDMWSTGVDFARLQVLYRADARQSQILDAQWPGRACRLYEGKARGLVVDCFDAFDGTLRERSVTRRRHYKAQGWTEDWPTVRGGHHVI